MNDHEARWAVVKSLDVTLIPCTLARKCPKLKSFTIDTVHSNTVFSTEELMHCDSLYGLVTCTFLYLSVPLCTFRYPFVPFCTSMYLLVPLCIFLYLIVPSCTSLCLLVPFKAQNPNAKKPIWNIF